MNEQLTKLLEIINDGSYFIKDQTPEVVQQILDWSFMSSIVWAIFASVVFMITCVCIYTTFKEFYAEELTYKQENKLESLIPFLLIYLFILFTSVITIIYKIIILIKILIAPKLFIMSYIKDFIN